MYYYRLYYLDSKADHFIDFREFRASGDFAAIVKAGIPLKGELRELWNQGRKVLEFHS